MDNISEYIAEPSEQSDIIDISGHREEWMYLAELNATYSETDNTVNDVLE